MPDLSSLSHFPKNKFLSKMPVYLSGDKDFIALAKESIQILIYIFFSYFWNKTYVVGTH